MGEIIKKSGRLLGLLAVLALLPACGGRMSEISGQGPAPAAPTEKAGRLRDQGNGTCVDRATGKIWQVAKSKRITSLAAANDYVHGLDLAGHDDWRLPTVAELYELFLLFDTRNHGDCPMEFEGNYWSADVDKKGRVGAWELDGDCHPEREYVPKEAGFVRAVRP
jgi:hypothetical protein